MQIIKGNKRKTTLMIWDEQIKKAEKKLEDSKKCYEMFGDADSKAWIEEDERHLEELIKRKNQAINYMDMHGI